jgi:hypothetical protein
VHLCNLCCSWKEIRITSSECVLVSLGIQNAMGMACPALKHLFTISHKWHNLKKKRSYWTKKSVSIFSTTFVWNISHYTKNLARYYHQCTFFFMLSIHNSCQILMKIEFSQQMFEQYSNIKFHVSLSSGSQVVPWNRKADRYDAANSHFSQFCKCT